MNMWLVLWKIYLARENDYYFLNGRCCKMQYQCISNAVQSNAATMVSRQRGQGANEKITPPKWHVLQSADWVTSRRQKQAYVVNFISLQSRLLANKIFHKCQVRGATEEYFLNLGGCGKHSTGKRTATAMFNGGRVNASSQRQGRLLSPCLRTSHWTPPPVQQDEKEEEK